MRLGVSSEVSVPVPLPEGGNSFPGGLAQRSVLAVSWGRGWGGAVRAGPGWLLPPSLGLPGARKQLPSQTSPKIGNSEEDGERGPRKEGHWWHYHPEPMTPTLLGVVWPDRGDPEGSLALCGRDHPVREQKALSLLSKSPWAMRPVSPPVESRDLRSGPCALVLAATAPTH